MVEIVCITAALVCVGILVANCTNDIRKKSDEISIKEAMDLAEIPIVTFLEGNIKLNFLLDSGSTNSYVSESCAKTLIGTPVDIGEFKYLTSTGTDSVGKMIESVLKYKDTEFTTKLLVNSGLDTSFAGVKESCGVQLHGILGSDFLKEHGYVLDFSRLVVYHKKKNK